MSLTRAIGLMSGTSMDAIDVAFIETDGIAQVVQGPARSYPYTPEDRALLQAAAGEAASLPPGNRMARPGALAAAEAMLTERHSQALAEFFAAEGLVADVIGFHGQTVIHRPAERFTIQIGEGEALARRLGIPVVYDFRAADVEAGGQGAPLVPVYHQALAQAAGLAGPLVIVNIGGVANLTFIDSGDPIAFDTGPGNALIDDLMRRRAGGDMDEGGATAASGSVNPEALGNLLAHPYFDLPPPKSIDRNMFSSAPVESLSLPDAAATLTAFTARTIARGFAHLPQEPALAILCGGGAHNLTLRWDLMQLLPCGAILAEALGWSTDAMEAQAFAFLAVRRLKDLPITFPTTTGVSAPMTGGRIAVPGR
ncbi:MAG TPA: anhydro-N-acetylmuramic acid kinase [Methylovirgula sp.]|nr:anhydro-N-acetylmuramic acid kinase [Methylovirgula sp.]